MVFPKTILLSRTLPGIGHVGEIILADVVRHVGIDRFHCVAPVSSKYTYQPDPGLSGLSVKTIASDQLEAKRRWKGRWGALGSLLNFRTGFQAAVARCTQEVADEGRKVGAAQVFAVLENPLTFAVAHRVASRLRVPMQTLVWDPPEYLCRTAGFDRWSRKNLLREFHRTLAASTRVAVVSDAMRRAYSEFTDAPIQILRHGIPVPESVDATKVASLSGGEWLIGFAGSMYANDAWMALLNALDQVGWRVAGRQVRIRLLSGKVTLSGRQGANIEYLGFRPPEQVQDALSDCHITYMPQPFSAGLRDLCRFAFPTKFSNYLALGRPVFVHAPTESALSAFVDSNSVGVRVDSLNPVQIISNLEQFLLDVEAYRAACTATLEVATKFFSRDVFSDSVDSFLGINATITPSCAASPAS